MENKTNLRFVALDQRVESNIVKPTERPNGKGWYSWGSNNRYPDYLLDLYKDGRRPYVRGQIQV